MDFHSHRHGYETRMLIWFPVSSGIFPTPPMDVGQWISQLIFKCSHRNLLKVLLLALEKEHWGEGSGLCLKSSA